MMGTMMTLTALTVTLIAVAGIRELTAAGIAIVRLHRAIAHVPELRAPQHEILEAIATTREGVNLNRPGFDAASFFEKDAPHAEEVPERAA
jgi:hypothetical protein